VRLLCDAGKCELGYDGGDCGSKKCKRGCGDAYGGVWPSMVWRDEKSGGLFCVGVFGSRFEDVFTSNLLYKESCIFCTYNAI
jgi:hypothetical protein